MKIHKPLYTNDWNSSVNLTVTKESCMAKHNTKCIYIALLSNLSDNFQTNSFMASLKEIY